MSKSITIEFNEVELFKDILTGDVKESLDACNKIIERLEAVKGQIYSKAIPKYHFMSHRIPCNWDCSQSPIGTCVYYVSDTWSDDCIFCHNPEERK